MITNKKRLLTGQDVVSRVLRILSFKCTLLNGSSKYISDLTFDKLRPFTYIAARSALQHLIYSSFLVDCKFVIAAT